MNVRCAGKIAVPRTLNIGCGKKKIAGAVNLDRMPANHPDIVHDLNRCPWPFSSGTFDQVHAHDVLEHLGDIVSIMEEIHRVCVDGARLSLRVPHFSSANAFTDPTHRHYFGYFSFDYFTGAHDHDYYMPRRFRLLSRSIIFHVSIMNKLVWRLARRWPAHYEQRWAWICPAWFLAFELEVVKQPVG